MISDDLDYRAEASAERWPIWIGRSAIMGLNGRRFPIDPEDPPADPRDKLDPERRRVYDQIGQAGPEGASGPELQLQLELDRHVLYGHLRALKRLDLIFAELDEGARGHRKRYWPK